MKFWLRKMAIDTPKVVAITARLANYRLFQESRTKSKMFLVQVVIAAGNQIQAVLLDRGDSRCADLVDDQSNKHNRAGRKRPCQALAWRCQKPGRIRTAAWRCRSLRERVNLPSRCHLVISVSRRRNYGAGAPHNH